MFFPDYIFEKCFSVDRQNAVLFDGAPVGVGAISLVVFKTILRKFLAQPSHFFIARDFRNDRSKRDNKLCLVTADDRLLRVECFWCV